MFYLALDCNMFLLITEGWIEGFLSIKFGSKTRHCPEKIWCSFHRKILQNSIKILTLFKEDLNLKSQNSRMSTNQSSSRSFWHIFNKFLWLNFIIMLSTHNINGTRNKNDKFIFNNEQKIYFSLLVFFTVRLKIVWRSR
jgi:hypothetical protein